MKHFLSLIACLLFTYVINIDAAIAYDWNNNNEAGHGVIGERFILEMKI